MLLAWTLGNPLFMTSMTEWEGRPVGRLHRFRAEKRQLEKVARIRRHHTKDEECANIQNQNGTLCVVVSRWSTRVVNLHEPEGLCLAFFPLERLQT